MFPQELDGRVANTINQSVRSIFAVRSSSSPSSCFDPGPVIDLSSTLVLKLSFSKSLSRHGHLSLPKADLQELWTLLVLQSSYLHLCASVIERYKKLIRRWDTRTWSLYFATPLVFNARDGGFPWDDLRKNLHGNQRMTKVQNGEEI